MGLARLKFDNQQGTFVATKSIVGAASKATAYIDAVVGSTLFLDNVSGIIQDNEIIYQATIGNDLFDPYKGTFDEANLLGSEAITAQNDRDFSGETIGNWAIGGGGSGTLTYNTDSIGGADDKQALLTSSSDTVLRATLDTNYWTATINTFYKATVNVYVPAGNTLKDVQLRSAAFGVEYITSATLLGNTWTPLTLSFYVASDTIGAIRVTFDGDPADGDKLYFDDISIKPVDISWVPYSTNAIEIEDDTLKITCDGSSVNGAYLYLRDAYDLTSNLTTGKEYKLTFDAKRTGGDVTASIGGTDDPNESVIITGTSFESYALHFIATNPTFNYIRMGDMSSGEIAWIDNLVLKEITPDLGSEMVTDGGLENWTGNDPDDWSKQESGSSTVTDETTIKHGGSHSAKVYIDAVGSLASLIQYSVGQVQNHFHRMSLWLYGDGSGDVRISDDGGEVGVLNETEQPSAAWNNYVYRWQTGAVGDDVKIKRTGDGYDRSFYIDDVSVKEFTNAALADGGLLVGMVGNLSRTYTAPRQQEGDLDATGLLARKFTGSRQVSGGLSFTGIVEGAIELIQRAIAGAFTFGAGILTRVVTFKRLEEGDLTATGTIARKGTLGRAVLGILTSTGIVSRKGTLYRALAGDVSFSGVVDYTLGLIKRAVAGTITFGAGVLTRVVTFKRLQEGDLDTTGTVVRKGTLGRVVLGALTSTGVVNRKGTLYRALAGDVTFSGTVDWSIGLIKRAVAGAFGFATSSLTRIVTFKRQPEGDLDVTGTVKRKGTLYRALSGTVTFSGTVDWSLGLLKRAVAGAFGFGASLTRVVTFKRQQEGTQAHTGSLLRKFLGKRDTAGTVSGQGVISRAFIGARQTLGQLTSTGALSRKGFLYRSLTAEVTFSGIIKYTVGILGVIIDPFVESVTAVRSYMSKTAKRSYVVKTIKRVIKSIDVE